jgi:tetratricopeptide (TPR) repeat protein
MLKDLEKRDAFLDENPDQVLDGLYSAYDIEMTNKKKSGNKFVFLLIIISAILLFSAYLNSDDLTYLIPVEKEISVEAVIQPVQNRNEKEEHVVEKNIVSETEVIVEIKKDESKYFHSLKLDEQIFLEKNSGLSIKSKVNRIESVQFETDNSGINLIIKMPDEIDYLVYGLNNPDRTVIEIKNVELGFRLEELEPVEPIVAIRYSINDDRRFKLVLESDKPLTIRKSVTGVSNDTHDLVVMMESQWQSEESIQQEDIELAVIVEKQVELEKNTIFKGDLIKRSVNISSNAYAEKLFQEAYVAYQKGNTSESLKKLNMALNQDAGHIKARSTLALVLSEKEHYELAYSVLNEGLIQYPENIEWIKMYARLLLNEGKIVEARTMLEKQQPELVLNTEYYALQAAVLQKLSEYEEAAKIYRNLLHVNPLKGIWWMGLGISLESLKRYDDALYAYQKASKNTSLAKDSHQFILQRISRLSNILEDEST